MEKILFNHVHLIVDGNKEYLDGAILVNGEYIENVFPNADRVELNVDDCKVVDTKGAICMPGFFDSHIRGYKDIDFNDCTSQELDDISNELLKVGTISFFTSLTSSEQLKTQIINLDNTETSGAHYLGIHLEGPFLSPNQCGLISPTNILEPSIDELNNLTSLSSKIKQMSIAPELNGSEEVINELNKMNIKVMLGHSDGIFNDDYNAHFDGFSNLFNDSLPLLSKDNSLVNLAFNHDDSYKEIICDGKSVNETVLKIALRQFRKDRIIIISNASNNDSRCSSSILDGIKTLRKLGACYTDLLLMSSLNAYRLYGLDNRYGTLGKGKYADIVFLDSKLNLMLTYARGRIIHV